MVRIRRPCCSSDRLRPTPYHLFPALLSLSRPAVPQPLCARLAPQEPGGGHHGQQDEVYVGVLGRGVCRGWWGYLVCVLGKMGVRKGCVWVDGPVCIWEGRRDGWWCEVCGMEKLTATCNAYQFVHTAVRLDLGVPRHPQAQPGRNLCGVG